MKTTSTRQWVPIAIMLAAFPIAAQSGWSASQQDDVHRVSRLDTTGTATLSIGRSENADYGERHHAEATLTFDDALTWHFRKAHPVASKHRVRWSMDGKAIGFLDGRWASGKLHLAMNASALETWQAGSTVVFRVDPKGKNFELSFDLNGLGDAFSHVASAVPSIVVLENAPNTSGPLLAGLSGVSNPVLIESSKVAPRYPTKARNKRATGKVILQAVVRKDGTVDNLSVIHCNRPGLGFENAATNAVSRWRYLPARLEGKPVDAYFTIVVDFSLR